VIEPFSLQVVLEREGYRLMVLNDVLGIVRRRNARGQTFFDSLNLLGQVSPERGAIDVVMDDGEEEAAEVPEVRLEPKVRLEPEVRSEPEGIRFAVQRDMYREDVCRELDKTGRFPTCDSCSIGDFRLRRIILPDDSETWRCRCCLKC